MHRRPFEGRHLVFLFDESEITIVSVVPEICLLLSLLKENYIYSVQQTNFPYIKGEPELTDPFNLLIDVKLRML